MLISEKACFTVFVLSISVCSLTAGIEERCQDGEDTCDTMLGEELECQDDSSFLQAASFIEKRVIMQTGGTDSRKAEAAASGEDATDFLQEKSELEGRETKHNVTGLTANQTKDGGAVPQKGDERSAKSGAQPEKPVFTGTRAQPEKPVFTDPRDSMELRDVHPNTFVTALDQIRKVSPSMLIMWILAGLCLAGLAVMIIARKKSGLLVSSIELIQSLKGGLCGFGEVLQVTLESKLGDSKDEAKPRITVCDCGSCTVPGATPQETLSLEGRWLLSKVEGDMDATLYDIGVGVISRNFIQAINFGVGMQKLEIRIKENTISLEESGIAPVSYTWEIGGGLQTFVSSAGPAMVEVHWGPDQSTLNGDFRDGNDEHPHSKTYKCISPSEFIEIVIAPSGRQASYHYKRQSH